MDGYFWWPFNSRVVLSALLHQVRLSISYPNITQFHIGHRHKVLVTVSGCQSTYDTWKLIFCAITFFLSKPPGDITIIGGSSWVIIYMKNQADTERLIVQKILVHQRRSPKKLVLFCRIVRHSSLKHVVEVKNLRHPDELIILKTQLATENATVIAEVSPEVL